MTLTATYDPQLSRVRLMVSDPSNPNPFFETDTAGWVPVGGTFVRSSEQAHQGSFSGKFTPDGVTSNARVDSARIPVTPGAAYRARVWVFCAGARDVSVPINWWDTNDGYVATAIATSVAVAANTWTLIEDTFTAPAGVAQGSIVPTLPGTSTSSDVLYIDEATVQGTSMGTATEVRFERSPNAITWTVLRGGAAVPVTSSGTASVDDYEFLPDVLNHYRAVPTGQPAQTTTITPTLGTIWLKSLSRPFLNRTVRVNDWSEVERPSRNGVFPIVGRSVPVAVTDVRGSRRYELTVFTETLAEADDLDTVLASGDPVLVHVPPDCPVPRSMYAVIGDLTIERRSLRGVRRYFTLPLTEVAPPGPDVVGATVTWQSIVNAFASWSDLTAAEPTWQDVAERIGDASEVVVP